MRDLVQAEPSFRDALEPGERVLWHSHPGAGALFLSLLPRMLRDLAFLALAVAALLLVRPGEVQPWNLAILFALVIFLSWSLYREWREATASKVSHYLITDRRLVWILPRAEGRKLWSIWQPSERTEDPELARIIAVDLGRVRAGRATVRIRLKSFVKGRNSDVRFWVKTRVRLHGVTEPEKAVQLLQRRI